MNKKVVNDIRSLLLFVPMIAFFVILLVLSLTNTDNSNNILIFIVVFGGGGLLSVVCLALTFEVIHFYQDRLISIKLFRHVEIIYSEISTINRTNKIGIGGAGIEPVWEIKTHCEQTVYLIRTKKREKIIKEIGQTIGLIC